MSELIRTLRFGDADAAYRLLVEAHRGLSPSASAALDARLVLLIANQVGDLSVLSEAIAAARASLPDDRPDTGTG